MGDGKEGKVHRDLVFASVAEPLVLPVEFYLSEDGLRLYTPSPPVLFSIIGSESCLRFLPVASEPVVDLDDPVALGLEATSSQRASFTTLRLVPRALRDLSAFCF